VLIVDDEFGILTERGPEHFNHSVKNRSVSRVERDDISYQNLHTISIRASELMNVEGLRSEFATTAHEGTHKSWASPLDTILLQRSFIEGGNAAFLPTNNLLVQFPSNIFEHNSTKTLQDSYKSARTLTRLQNECYLFHVLRAAELLAVVTVKTGVMEGNTCSPTKD
jgi:hypothetical protein